MKTSRREALGGILGGVAAAPEVAKAAMQSGGHANAAQNSLRNYALTGGVEVGSGSYGLMKEALREAFKGDRPFDESREAVRLSRLRSMSDAAREAFIVARKNELTKKSGPIYERFGMRTIQCAEWFERL